MVKKINTAIFQTIIYNISYLLSKKISLKNVFDSGFGRRTYTVDWYNLC